jgi:hypothetical protein
VIEDKDRLRFMAGTKPGGLTVKDTVTGGAEAQY